MTGYRWENAMRFIGLLLLLALLSGCVRDRITGCDTIEKGGTLHLVRSNVDTVRARFCYAADCALIAAQMNKAERARWHCE